MANEDEAALVIPSPFPFPVHHTKGIAMKQTNINVTPHPKIWARLVLIITVPVYVTLLFWMLCNSTVPSSTSTVDHPLLAKSMASNSDSTMHGQSSRNKQHQQYEQLATQIANKWNITTPHGIALLTQQFYKPLSDYNPLADFLHFHHIAKTGGTTISDILNATLGTSGDAGGFGGGGGIMPGSDRSGFFDQKKFHATILANGRQRSNITGSNGTNQGGLHYVASYGHTRLRPIHGPNRTNLAQFFEQYFQLLPRPKRLRSLAMLREPTDLRASTHAMAMCAINGRVNTFNWRREKKGLPRVCTPKEGLNISSLIDDHNAKALRKCGDVSGSAKQLNKLEQMICNKGPSSIDYCRGASELLSSEAYQHMRSMYKSLMGRYFARQEIGVVNYISIENSVKRNDPGGFSMDEVVHWVEEYTLIDLGGLDVNIESSPYDGRKLLKGMSGGRPINTAPTKATAEPDFLWFGITERMHESTCLLFYALGVKPLPEIPRERVVNCSPTSWWNNEERHIVREREQADYAIWRTANAMLDVRVWMMREEVIRKMENGEGWLSVEERDRLNAFVEAGCVG